MHPKPTVLAVALALMPLIWGCNTPTVGFRPDHSRDVAVGGHRFTVHLSGARAQVIRLNRISLGQGRAAVRAARLAAEQASGCRVAEVLPGSDPVLVKLALECPRGAADQ